MEPTAEQEAYLKKLADPHYYGDQDENGVDLSLIRENLKLSPLERVRQAHRQAIALLELRRHVQRVR